MPLYNKLSVAAIPIDIVAGRKDDNLGRASAAIAALPPATDIAVLPELFTTAFIPDKPRCLALAEDNDGPTLNWARQTARRFGTAIAGSFIAADGGRLFNRAFFVEPGGDAIFYDKRHTFSIGRESEIMSKGQSMSPIARFRGWNIALSVCYDLRFPVWMRNTGLKYDLMIVPANWPDLRAFAWEHLLQARAIENQAYIIGANRAGTDAFGSYTDLSRIYDYKGRSVGEASGDAITARLSKTALLKVREEMPVYLDSDNFSLNLP